MVFGVVIVIVMMIVIGIYCCICVDVVIFECFLLYMIVVFLYESVGIGG